VFVLGLHSACACAVPSRSVSTPDLLSVGDSSLISLELQTVMAKDRHGKRPATHTVSGRRGQIDRALLTRPPSPAQRALTQDEIDSVLLVPGACLRPPQPCDCIYCELSCAEAQRYRQGYNKKRMSLDRVQPGMGYKEAFQQGLLVPACSWCNDAKRNRPMPWPAGAQGAHQGALQGTRHQHPDPWVANACGQPMQVGCSSTNPHRCQVAFMETQ
jgi:hypothetical protein